MWSDVEPERGHRQRAAIAAGRRRPPRTPLRVAVEIVLASVLCGLVMGAAWYVLSPDLTGQAADQGVAVPIEQARRLFDRVAIFALLGAAAGLLLGVAAGIRHRERPVTALVTLALGGVAGSLLAMGTGMVLGPARRGHEPGTEVPLPMELEATSALLVWPLVAIVVVTLMALFRDDRTPWSAETGARDAG